MNSSTWLRQPTTMFGLALLASAAAMAAFGLIPLSVFGCLLPPALALIGFDDNTAFDSDVKTLATDVLASTVQGHLRDNLPRLIQEAVKSAANFTAPAPVTPAIRVPATGGATALVVLLALGLPLCLAACGTGAPFKANTAVACAVDGVLQPIGAATLTALVPETAHGVSIDTLIVHPAIVKLCTDMNGVPVQAATP